MTDTIPTLAIDPAAVRARLWRVDATYQLVCRNPVAFGRVVRRQRKDLQLSIRSAAAMCHLSYATIFDVEAATYATSARATVDNIMDAFGITRSDILAEIRAMQDEEAADEAA